jgi:hypothetical protein
MSTATTLQKSANTDVVETRLSGYDLLNNPRFNTRDSIYRGGERCLRASRLVAPSCGDTR